MIRQTTVLVQDADEQTTVLLDKEGFGDIIIAGSKDHKNEPHGELAIQQGDQLIKVPVSLLRNFAAVIDFFAGKDSKLGY